MNMITLLYAVGALLVVLLLVAGAGRAARAAGLVQLTSSARLRVVEKLSLDPRRRLLLLRCDGRDLLLLTGPHNDLVVGWITPAPCDPSTGPAS